MTQKVAYNVGRDRRGGPDSIRVPVRPLHGALTIDREAQRPVPGYPARQRLSFSESAAFGRPTLVCFRSVACLDRA